jgi:hypothetical protein
MSGAAAPSARHATLIAGGRPRCGITTQHSSAIFSDGITEAMHGDEEFGEGRLEREFKAHLDVPAARIVADVLASVQEFSAGEQSDDLTLVVLRAIQGQVGQAGGLGPHQP